ncbi:adenosine kinase [Schistosoma bovis]|uniref:Adenosine kinase n=2 Tax=Schistosoma bovis TaxID=6184 RepID=A0A430PXE0_SCHBO|nr:adenosine kinase [Schistosoma bovis]
MKEKLVKMRNLPEGYVFGMGNPLLDILVDADDYMYERYELQKDNAILAEEKHMEIYEEIQKRKDAKYVAGGATLNTVKMIQWILQKPFVCSYVGCIGSDLPGKYIKNDCRGLDLLTDFQITTKPLKTGKVAILISENLRSMVTYLGAACDLSLAHIEQPHVWSLVEKAQVYYIAGFVINTCYEGMLKVAKHSLENGKLFCFNLSAAFLPQFNTKEVNEMISYSGVVIGNESEAAAFGDAHSLTDKTIHAAARYIADLPFVDGKKRKRLVIVTQGKDPIIYTDSTDPTVHQYVVEQLKDEEMVDTNGAGDSFAAGFIADYIRGKPMITSLQSGVRAAAYIIRRSGFSLGSRESSAFKINL